MPNTANAPAVSPGSSVTPAQRTIRRTSKLVFASATPTRVEQTRFRTLTARVHATPLLAKLSRSKMLTALARARIHATISRSKTLTALARARILAELTKSKTPTAHALVTLLHVLPTKSKMPIAHARATPLFAVEISFRTMTALAAAQIHHFGLPNAQIFKQLILRAALVSIKLQKLPEFRVLVAPGVLLVRP